VRRGLQLHHVVKRSHAPRRLLDETNLAVLCPPHHAQTDAPFARGRLVIAAGEEGRVFAVVTKPNKWT
jgi:5-methylcytosine-specific restriction endonuclease McrA